MGRKKRKNQSLRTRRGRLIAHQSVNTFFSRQALTLTAVTKCKVTSSQRREKKSGEQTVHWGRIVQTLMKLGHLQLKGQLSDGEQPCVSAVIGERGDLCHTAALCAP